MLDRVKAGWTALNPHVNPCPHTTNLQQTPLKSSRPKLGYSSYFKVWLINRDEIVEANREIAQNLLLPQYFQKSSAAEVSESICMWEGGWKDCLLSWHQFLRIQYWPICLKIEQNGSTIKRQKCHKNAFPWEIHGADLIQILCMHADEKFLCMSPFFFSIPCEIKVFAWSCKECKYLDNKAAIYKLSAHLKYLNWLAQYTGLLPKLFSKYFENNSGEWRYNISVKIYISISHFEKVLIFL